jgi:phosphoribosyl-AMP cyclohydrolase
VSHYFAQPKRPHSHGAAHIASVLRANEKCGGDDLDVAGESDTLDVLFVGYANQEAVEVSLTERITVLWSTSRGEMWRKGATSGDVLGLVEIRVNCEQNSLLYLVRRTTGGACRILLPSGAARPSCYLVLTDGSTLRPASAP